MKYASASLGRALVVRLEVGAGTLFPDEADRPALHLHAAFGRDDKVTAGCIRAGARPQGRGDEGGAQGAPPSSRAPPKSVSGAYLRLERSPGSVAASEEVFASGQRPDARHCTRSEHKGNRIPAESRCAASSSRERRLPDAGC